MALKELKNNKAGDVGSRLSSGGHVTYVAATRKSTVGRFLARWMDDLVKRMPLATILGGNQRVVGGDYAPEEFGKFHASLQNLTGHHVCGGAVISPSHVVTAAHCIYGAEAQYIKVVVGTNNLDSGGIQYDVETLDVHKEYDYNTRINDIAILKTNGFFNLQYVHILSVDDEELLEGDLVLLTGFGAQEPNGQSSRQMHALNLTVFNQETCEYAMRYSREVVHSMFCTFTQIGEGTCHGDSGGPLIKNNKLVGLVSWGIPCAVGFPDVHTRISSYANWIKEEIK
ncbi:chymotrypsin-1 [Aphomia sociella]